MSLWLWLWHALYLAGKTAAHSSRGSLHISFSACLSGDHWQSQVSPFLYWNSTLFVLLTRHYNDPTAHPFHLYCAHHEIRAVSLSSLLPGTEQVGSVWQVSRMAIVFVAFPSRGEAYFSTPSIWPDLVTCFKQENAVMWPSETFKSRPQDASWNTVMPHEEAWLFCLRIKGHGKGAQLKANTKWQVSEWSHFGLSSPIRTSR